MSLRMFSKAFIKMTESKKKQESSYAGPCPVVHISTYPMQLASKMKKKKEADSGSTHPQVLRGQKNETKAH